LKILIKDLKLYGYHGVREYEKKDGQDFIFNICIYIEDSSLKNSDDLKDTLSYSDIIKVISKINKDKRFDLLETLSRTIAEKIIRMSGLVQKVDIRIEKPRPPIDENLGSVGVEYSLSRYEMLTVKEEEMEVFLSIGSNMGDRKKNIVKAMDLLNNDPRLEMLEASSFYETEPMYVGEQANFYNIAAKIKVKNDMDPFGLLGLIKSIEYDMGRESGKMRNGPRPIDIDILYFGDKKIESDILKIPHPRICERKFVLMPLGEIAPEIKIDDMDIREFIELKKLPEKVKKLR